MLASVARPIRPIPAGLSQMQSCICHTQIRMSATVSRRSFHTGPRLISSADDADDADDDDDSSSRLCWASASSFPDRLVKYCPYDAEIEHAWKCVASIVSTLLRHSSVDASYSPQTISPPSSTAASVFRQTEPSV